MIRRVCFGVAVLVGLLTAAVPLAAQIAVTFHSPGLTYNRNAFRYDPKPYLLTITVLNQGTTATQPASVRIVLQPPFTLDSSELSAMIRPSAPAPISPGDSLRLTWKLVHPLVLTPYVQRVTFWVKRGSDSAMHGINIPIPGADPAELQAFLSGGLSLLPRADSLGYLGNPFEVRLRLFNSGGTDADSVFVNLQLPPKFTLVQPTAPAQVLFPKLHPVPIGDPRFDIAWTVRYTGSTRLAIQDSIVATVSGRTIAGGPISARSAVYVDVAGLPPRLAVVLDAPAALQYDTGAVYAPNPMPLRARLINAGEQEADLRSLRLFTNGDGVSPRQDSSRVLAPLAPGEIDTLHWDVDVARGRAPRIAAFRVDVTDGDQETVTAETTVDIPGRNFGLDLEQISVPDSIPLNAAGTDYLVRQFDVRFKARNTYWGNARIVLTRVTPIGLGVAPAAPVSETPNTLLLPDELSREYVATFRVIGGLTPSLVNFDIVAVSSLGDTGRARRTVSIPALAPRLRLTHSGVDSLNIDTPTFSYTPNPFEKRFTVTNEGSASVRLDSLAVDVYTDGLQRVGERTFIYATVMPQHQSETRAWIFQAERRTKPRHAIIIATAYYEKTRILTDTAFVYIPGFEPSLRVDIEAPSAVEYDSIEIYRPTQITLFAVARNTGPIAFVLDSMRFVPGDPWGPAPSGARALARELQPGDSLRLSWPLEFIASLRPDSTRGEHAVTAYFDTTRVRESRHITIVPGRPTSLRIENIAIPPALAVRPDGRDYVENPLVTSFRVFNDSWVRRVLTRTTIGLNSGAGLTPRTPLDRTHTQILSPYALSAPIVDTFDVAIERVQRTAIFSFDAFSSLIGYVRETSTTLIPGITPSGLAGAPLPAGLTIGSAYPNPAAAGSSVSVSLRAGSVMAVRVEVFTLLGTPAFPASEITLVPGEQLMSFGIPTPGVYMLRIHAASFTHSQLLIMR